VIDVLVDDDPLGFGVLTALAIEGMPVRRIAHATECTGRVLVVSGDRLDGSLDIAERQEATVVIGGRDGGGAEEPVVMPLQGEVWSMRVQRIANAHGHGELSLPRARVQRVPAGWSGAVLATCQNGRGQWAPAVVQRNRLVWCLVDVGSAITDLVSESYLSEPNRPSLRAGASQAALARYYRAADAVRCGTQRASYPRLDRRLRSLGARASSYPVDVAGWLLIELIVGLIRAAAGETVRLARWPAPYRSAAALTHDVEPSIYAYTDGLEQLLARVARSALPATFGLVAGPATRSLFVRAETELRRAEILCHGLEHRGETLEGSRVEIAAGIERARALLERRFERPVSGFRSPRLDRSPDLVWALDQLGFEYDSSYPDVDRESLDNFGGGVRLNLPFRPPLHSAAGTLRPSRCLELPVSMPDCIQPLFQGDDFRQLRRVVRAKINMVHDTEGLYVGTVHGGVFGGRDAARRGAHLSFLARQLERPDVWLATLGDIARWWAARERLHLRVEADRILVSNRGQTAVAGVRVLMERRGDAITMLVPLLNPGDGVSLALPFRARAAPEVRVQEVS
jgi:peptidoglycan/xylan/chitin deacetylase (PgdA/CDA1 family)